MSEYVISVDSVSDLPGEYYKENNVIYTSLSYQYDNKTFYDDPNDVTSLKEFYAALRNGVEAKTSQVNVETYTKVFESILKEKRDILHISFSSGLSGSCQSATIAATDLNEKYPDNKIVIVDSLAASLGYGLLVDYAVNKKKAGMPIEELTLWLEENKLHLAHWFTVDDLFFLKRGGRVNAASAIVGTMLAIKPVLHVDNEGHLIPVSKVRGRQQSLKALVDKMVETAIEPENQTVFISHGDCLEEAQYVEKLVKERYPNVKVMINYVGSTVGAHSGPGTMAFFFMAKQR